MRYLSILPILLFFGTSVGAQDAPMGCFVREYSKSHLAQNPEQVVQRISILFAPESSYLWAEVKVLLADQGHAGRDGYGGMRVSEMAGSFNGLSSFGVECDGGGFDVIVNDATGITIETDWLRVAEEGCGGAGIYTTLLEDGSSTTRYRLDRAEDAACQW